MAQTMPAATAPRHRLLPEMASKPAKADLRNPEIGPWRESVGAIVRRTRALTGLNLDEFADLLSRDQRQISRWESGQERAQLDAFLAVAALRNPFLQALGEAVGAEIEISIRTRRSA